MTPIQRHRVVIVGAGPTGVELAGQIRELAIRTLRAEFRHIHPEDAHVLLFDGGVAPLASFGAALSAKAAATLERLGVELRLGSTVTGVDGDGLTVRERSGATVRYGAGTVLWAAGVAAQLAVHPHRLPHRVSPPRRRGPHLGRHVRPRLPAGTDPSHPADRVAAAAVLAPRAARPPDRVARSDRLR